MSGENIHVTYTTLYVGQPFLVNYLVFIFYFSGYFV